MIKSRNSRIKHNVNNFYWKGQNKYLGYSESQPKELFTKQYFLTLQNPQIIVIYSHDQ